MGFYISIIGIDGSGKSTLAPVLADLVAAELGLTTIAVGDDLWGNGPEADLFQPGFRPHGDMLSSRLGRLFRRAAKAATAQRRLYPLLKLIQLACQERTVSGLASRYQPGVIFSDGNLLLSSAGRAINYVGANADPATTTAGLNPLPYLETLHAYIFGNASLSRTAARSIPGLNFMRWLGRLDLRFQLELLRLPDAVIFLDVAPETALARLRSGNQRLDHHENNRDLSQAQAMYRGVAEFFRRRRGESNTLVIDATDLSIGETLEQIIDFVRSLPLLKREEYQEQGLLGTPAETPSRTSAILKKVLNHRYLIRCVLPNLHRGSAPELTFPLSKLGRLLIKEGYSARVMRAIYLQNSQPYGLLDKIFLDYPLHRAIYQRLQILNRAVEGELRHRLANLPDGATLQALTAPSGYAFDLFQPLERLTRSDWPGAKPLHVLASDLDPDGDIERQLGRTAPALGIGFEFVQGNLTSAELRARLKRSGPFDMVLFVGFSCWISKTHLVHHLKLIRRRLLAPGGVLFSDCFTPDAFALSGNYLGYKANYYSPREFSGILAYCGFERAGINWESSPEGISHVCRARAGSGSETWSSPRSGYHRFAAAHASGG